jgi:hypothetical protein
MTDALRPAGNDSIWSELAAWYLLAADLRHVVAATRALQHQQKQSGSDPALLRCLWTSAHIAYARCFVDGPGAKLDQAMFDGRPDGRGPSHRMLLHTARGHLARPANPSLLVRVDLEQDGDGQPIGIRYTPSSNDTGAHDVASLAWLAAEALKHVETIEAGLIASLKAKLQASSN